MATPVQVGARNDLYALKEARRYLRIMTGRLDNAVNEVGRMRETVGRPDYGPVIGILGQIALDMAKQSRHLDEMLLIREQAKVGGETASNETINTSLYMRVALLEAEVAELKALNGEAMR